MKDVRKRRKKVKNESKSKNVGKYFFSVCFFYLF